MTKEIAKSYDFIRYCTKLKTKGTLVIALISMLKIGTESQLQVHIPVHYSVIKLIKHSINIMVRLEMIF